MSERGHARWKAIVAALVLVACDDVLGAEFEDPYVAPQPPTEEELIVRICQKFLDAGCTNAPPELTCRASLTTVLTKADASNCRKELRSYFECANESAVSCVNSGKQPSEPAISTACTPLKEAFDACESDSECQTGSAGNPTPDAGEAAGCSLNCSEYAAECVPNSSGFSCECTLGPNEGASFSSPGCTDIGDLVDENCR
jgi:hypothetical protein